MAEIAKPVGRKALAEIAGVAKPDAILAWYRKLVARKFERTKSRAARGDDCSDRSSRIWSLSWRGVTPIGLRPYCGSTGPVWGIRYTIKQSGTSFGGGVFRPHRNVGRARRGRTLGAFRQKGMPIEVGDVWRGSMRRAVRTYVPHFLEERNHHGKGNIL